MLNGSRTRGDTSFLPGPSMKSMDIAYEHPLSVEHRNCGILVEVCLGHTVAAAVGAIEKIVHDICVRFLYENRCEFVAQRNVKQKNSPSLFTETLNCLIQTEMNIHIQALVYISYESADSGKCALFSIFFCPCCFSLQNLCTKMTKAKHKLRLIVAVLCCACS